MSTQVIDARQVDVESAVYYEAGTEAIRHSFVLLDVINEALTARLQGEARQARQRLRWARAAALLLSAPAGYLLAGLG